MDQNRYRQWARPSRCEYILKELNAAVCEGLARETIIIHGSNQRSDFLDLSDENFGLHDAPINFIVFTMNPFFSHL